MPTIYTNLGRKDLCRYFPRYDEYEYVRIHDVLDLMNIVQAGPLEEKGPRPKHDDDVILIVDLGGLNNLKPRGSLP